MLGTIAKAGKVLDLFSADAQERGVSEVAAELKIPKSSAHALLATLCQLGLVRQLENSRYRLGWRLMELYRALVDTTTLLGPPHLQLQRVADAMNAIAHVGALEGPKVVFLDEAVGGQERNFAVSQIGHRAPALTTALGKVLLSFEERQADGLALQEAGRQARNELDQVCARGYAVDLQGCVPDLHCVAAPIFDASGCVQTAISFAVPPHRFSRDFPRLLNCVRWLTRDVTKASMLMHTKR
ncbi:IclR family transcriptional regulator [Amycolatopsis sp. GM8]|uniref:IclR family transcriptional regulator n=1 Tax=Amycolatopsis sp. GM8 TaxID=2896530 RepID=UPI001F266383|nr:IclR family transcriptional regulator [Amycolatopsis sp. GM8]